MFTNLLRRVVIMLAMVPPRQRNILLAGIGILLAGASVWGVASLAGGGEKTGVTLLPKELSAEALIAESKDPGKVMERVREAMNSGNLTEEQRHELRETMHTVMEAQMDQRVDEYFVASESERKAVLDRHIDEMQARMKEWQQRRAQHEQEHANRPEETRRQGGANATAASGAGGPGGGPGAGGPVADAGRGGPRGGRFGSQTQAQRKVRSESRNPDRTARRMAYFTALRKQAEARGIRTPGRFGMGRR